MPMSHDVETWDGQPLLTTDGDKVGRIESIYLDGDTDEPAWMAVKTSKLGSAVSLVPLHRATSDGDGITVPYDKEHIKRAPTFKPDDEISAEDARALYEHYAIAAVEPRRSVGHDTSGPTTDTAMTRSEEELRVGTAEYEAGRATLRKDVVTEHVETTVPVRHEDERVAEDVRSEQIHAERG